MKKISEEEYQKFQELLKKEKEKEKAKKLSRELYLEKLKTYKDKLLTINSTYGTVGAQALVFAKWLNNVAEANDTDEFYFNWEEMKQYFGKDLLKTEAPRKVNVKRQFRRQLSKRGWKMTINRKYNTLHVIRKR